MSKALGVVLCGLGFLSQDLNAAVTNYPDSLKTIKEVYLLLPNAEIQMSSEDAPQKGVLDYESLNSDSNCAIAVKVQGTELYIGENSHQLLKETPKVEVTTEAKDTATLNIVNLNPESFFEQSPVNKNCRYKITLNLRQNATAKIKVLGRGDIEMNRWNADISIKVDQGGVHFNRVKALAMECSNCDLGGEEVEGELKYKVGIGTVGIRGLSQSVNGESRGDVILKWSRIKADSKVHVRSLAGDISLQLPKNKVFTLKLSAPKGEVYSKAEGEHNGGIPVEVLAEAGTIRLVGI